MYRSVLRKIPFYPFFQVFCSGWGIISIKLVDYKNPGSTVFNGECCDTPTWCTYNSCENYFKFCVTSLGSLDPCNLGSSTTRVLGDDDFTFPAAGQSLGSNLVNPLTYNFSYWQVRNKGITDESVALVACVVL